MNNFKPRSMLLLEEIIEKLPSNDSTKVVKQRKDKGENLMTTRVVEIKNETEDITEEGQEVRNLDVVEGQ